MRMPFVLLWMSTHLVPGAATGHGTLMRQSGHRKQPEAAHGRSTLEVGGSALVNAFAGEEQFLQEASRSTYEKRARASNSASTFGHGSHDDTSGGDSFDVDAAKADSIAASSRERNAFATEQTFLNSLSTETPHKIKWAGNGDQMIAGEQDNQCVCGVPATIPRHNATLTMASCDTDSDMCKFIFPHADADISFGQIKWAHNTKQCVYVHNGWIGNGNSIHLWPCVATKNGHFQSQNFTIYGHAESGMMGIAWSPDAEVGANHCVDVNTRYSDHLQGHEVVLWDCHAGALWSFAESS